MNHQVKEIFCIFLEMLFQDYVFHQEPFDMIHLRLYIFELDLGIML